MILGENGIKMGKRHPEFVVNPADIVHEYGADTLRLYEMFMGPLEADKPWSKEGVVGAKKFLEKIPQSVWKDYMKNKCFEDTSLSSTLGSKNQESQWLKLMNEAGTDDGKTEKYVTDELATHIKAVYKKVSKLFAQKFEEERSLWENLFKGY
mgnify:CR=1 FL=1